MNRWLHSARVGVFPPTTTMRQNVGHRQNSRPDSIFLPSSPNSVLTSFSLSSDPEQRVSIKGWAELRQITLLSQPQIETFAGPPINPTHYNITKEIWRRIWHRGYELWIVVWLVGDQWMNVSKGWILCSTEEGGFARQNRFLRDYQSSVCLDILSQIHALMEPTTKSTKQQPTIIITTV